MERLKNNFTFPSLETEAGEIERVAKLQENPKAFAEKFTVIAKTSPLIELDDETWSKLENTDSKDIMVGDWQAVESLASQVNRDWQLLRTKLESGLPLDSPIILKVGDSLHLVSGNTRLMVSKAAGIRPMVLIVDMTE